jgi:hypothetical protein
VQKKDRLPVTPEKFIYQTRNLYYSAVIGSITVEDLCDTISGESPEPGMFQYQFFTWRHINTIYFITSNITMYPLYLRTQRYLKPL